MKTSSSTRHRLFIWGMALLALLSPAAATGSDRVSAETDSALFWSISRNGKPAGYLLGTIHSEDPRVLDFSTALVEVMTTNQVFAMEMVPDLPTLQRLTEYMQYQDGTGLESRIGAERFSRLQVALTPYRVPSDWIARMKVWAAMMTLSIPPPESGFFMDFSLSLRAAGAGLRVTGLETLEQQLAFLEDMPMQQQLALLDQALAEYHRVDEVHKQMVTSYLQGDVRELKFQAEEQMAQLDPDTRQYFMREGIDRRNQRMMQSLLPLLAKEQVFTAVGALHLPGEFGLIRLLRAQGYDLSPLPLPLNAAAQASSQEPAQAQNR
ncbi:MAG: TraB/GumN family protein [Xanthomonadales bacterium]|nr:TraB/GumN family protein [Gammaproteobacteria bacterium]MBT8053305.1 TraB/GumN family protein [Gammaproteobacteria bacterium]NND58017.1 TraB/GumN family protein [Xanthomonadales bacterium]NNK52114.1 TraB/GumN family protein [Xanthomonadales bacterium]